MKQIRIDSLKIQDHHKGATVSFLVKPSSKRISFATEIINGKLCVHLTAPPDKGKANKQLVEITAKSLNVAKSSIEILTGQTSRDKLLLIKSMDASELRERIRGILQ